MQAIVEKYTPDRQLAFTYSGEVLGYGTDCTIFTGHFRHDVSTPYMNFRQGDRTVEYFYPDRWYNILELHDVDDDRLKGWYCNIARPATFSTTPDGLVIGYVDLALDVFFYPDGRILMLDEDELADLRLDAPMLAQVYRAVDDLRAHAERGEAPFTHLKGNP